MDEQTEQRIRDRARQLWEAAGRPDGRDAEFWRQARQAELGEVQPAELGDEPPADPAKFAGF